MKMKLALLFMTWLSFFCQAIPEEPPSNINDWCSTTPHPEPCKVFMGGDHHHPFIPKQRADFRTMAVQVALDRALHMQMHANQLGQRCNGEHETAAWMDCSNLFNDTILQLNRTLQGLRNNGSCSDFDAQTWLSAALTNLETCRAVSRELGVTSFTYPILSNNVSELISNSLAVNGALLEQEETKDGFPSWVSVGQRKLLQSSSLASKANYVVAKDWSGNFRSIQAAIDHAVSKRNGAARIIIYVKKGTYTENVEISNQMNNILLVGDGFRYTIITGNRSAATGFTIYSSATFGVTGVGFSARGITFRNTAGPQGGQAVALRSASDLSVYYACSFEGYQDTIFALAQRQFFKYCYIYGTIDFIFGNAAVVFQNCVIYVRKPLPGQSNVITAQGRADPFQNTGISIQKSRVTTSPEFRAVAGSFDTYLGRPWQQYSRTVFLHSYLGSLVNPAGWLSWENTSFAQNTLYYGEYRNFGPGSSTTNRVKWQGYHVITRRATASLFSVTNLIAGGSWLPATGVPFTGGL